MMQRVHYNYLPHQVSRNYHVKEVKIKLTLYYVKREIAGADGKDPL